MAQKNQQKRKQAPRYSNPDPMSNVRDMGRYGIRVLREISKGKFNFYNEGHIFRNLNFTNATLEEVKKKITEANIHVTAMNFAYAESNDPDVKDLLMRDIRMAEAYTLCYNVLMMIINNGGDTRYLQILTTNLPRYKYNL